MARGKSSARGRANDSDSERELRTIGRHLAVCYAVAVVCVEAFEAQNADQDAEIRPCAVASTR